MSMMHTRLTVQDDLIVSQVVQDVEPILKRSAKLQDIGHVGGSDMKHAATLPMVLVEKYCNERAITFEEFMRDPAHIRRMCNDPDNAPFRVWRGRV